MAKDCLFCAIIAGNIPSSKVYEDEQVFAFLDLNPCAKGHTLIVPKFHAETVLELPKEYGASLIHATQRIGKALMEELNATGFNSVQNNFASAGQVIFHAHWHIVPRFEGDGLFDIPQGKYTSQDEMTALAQALAARTS